MKDPKYQIRIRMGGGKYLRSSSKTTHFKEAKRVALNQYTLLKTKEELGDDPVGATFKKAFINWKKYTLGTQTTRGGKWDRTVRTVELYALTFFGGMKLKSIKSKDFINYAQWRQENYKRTPPSNDSIIKEITAIRSFLTYCRDMGHIDDLPRIPKPKPVNRRRSTFTLDEYRKIYKGLRGFVKEGKPLGKYDDRYLLQHYILIMANTGLRVGEARELRWGDISRISNEKDDQITIVRVSGKTGEREAVFLDDTALNRLWEYKKEKIGRVPSADEHIFLSKRTNKPITSFKVSFNSLLDYIGVTVSKNGINRTIYSLRHFYATQRLTNGVNPYLLAQQMGTSVNMLEKHYGHVVTTDIAQSLNVRSNQYGYVRK